MKNTPTNQLLKYLPLISLLIVGVFFFFPQLNSQEMLSQGDHGRDLYCFKQTLDGAVPYRDYWWVYGPLMPYYYGIFLKLFGISIQSVLLGKVVLQILSGALLFLAASTLIELPWAFLATLWFWVFNPDFFFTYNHIGGVAALLAVTHCLCLYIQKPSPRYVRLGFIFTFVLSLVKLNIGVSSLAAFTLSLWTIDAMRKDLTAAKKSSYICLALVTLIVTGLIYTAFLKGLPFYYIQQCFPYFKDAHQFYSPVLASIVQYFHFIWLNMTSNLTNLIFGVVIIFLTVQAFSLLLKKDTDKVFKTNTLSFFAAFLIFSILNLHEFLNSGVNYRAHWITPFKFLSIFVVVATATRSFPRLIKAALALALVIMAITTGAKNYYIIKSYKDPTHYLSYPTAKIYVGNTPAWIETVQQTAGYLTDKLDKSESFFALPYDPLYYFLTARTSPTRQLIFFDHINITGEQEKGIIEQLEEKKINYVLLSSRCANNQAITRLGTFGVTNCPLLGKYFKDRFEQVAIFGDWQNPPGWAWNHGTIILKRKNPGQPQ